MLAPIVLCGLAAATLAGPGRAQDGGAADKFAAPVMIRAGEANAGEGRLFPSPVFHDVDADGRADLVIGDLVGIITVAKRLEGDGAPRFGPEARLKDCDGNDLKFHNW
jgi:hypothetical protein